VRSDPTTAAIAEQIADRERLQGEVTRLAKALVEAYTLNEVLTAERDRLRAAVRGAPITEKQVVTELHEGHAERRAAEGDNAWRSLLSDRDRLRALVEEACGELSDTGGAFAAKRAAEIRQAAGIEGA
jgi:hypothetical protein